MNANIFPVHCYNI